MYNVVGFIFSLKGCIFTEKKVSLQVGKEKTNDLMTFGDDTENVF